MFPVSLAKRDQTCLISHQASYKYIYLFTLLYYIYIQYLQLDLQGSKHTVLCYCVFH